MNNNTMDHVNSLLVRNWFVNEEDITELISQTTDENFDKIKKNVDKYSDRVRYIIAPQDFTCCSKLKTKCSELTDADMDTMTKTQKLADEAEFEEKWKEYSKTIGDRPYDSIDGQLDDMWDSLQAEKNRLTQLLNKKKIKYIAPSARGKGTVDPEQSIIEKRISILENEFQNIKNLVDHADSTWLDNKKNEYRIKSLF